MQYNHYYKNNSSKTGYIVDNKGPHDAIIFTKSMYLVKPRYINSRSPSYGLVNSKSQHISGLFPTGFTNIFLGDFQNRGLLVILEGLEGLEIFLSELPPVQLKAKLVSGELTQVLQRSRGIKAA